MNRSSPFATIIIPYYNQPAMLREQLGNWFSYPDHVKKALPLIIVDDGSRECQAMEVFKRYSYWNAFSAFGGRLFRINEDIPWNRGEARNIGYREAGTEWIVQVDIDHVLPPASAEAMWVRRAEFNPNEWYRFRRFRVGAADHTRNKDALARDVRFGEIKPHIDSYLCPTLHFHRAGGYNLEFSGCLGGGSPFLHCMEDHNGPSLMAPSDVVLHVHTTDSVKDASASLDRDTSEYKRRKALLKGQLRGHCEVRHQYERFS